MLLVKNKCDGRDDYVGFWNWMALEFFLTRAVFFLWCYEDLLYTDVVGGIHPWCINRTLRTKGLVYGRSRTTASFALLNTLLMNSQVFVVKETEWRTSGQGQHTIQNTRNQLSNQLASCPPSQPITMWLGLEQTQHYAPVKLSYHLKEFAVAFPKAQTTSANTW